MHARTFSDRRSLVAPLAPLAPGRRDGIEIYVDRQAEDVVVVQRPANQHFRGRSSVCRRAPGMRPGSVRRMRESRARARADLLARGSSAGTQQRQDRLTGVALEDVDGSEQCPRHGCRTAPAAAAVAPGRRCRRCRSPPSRWAVSRSRAEEVDVADADLIERARVGDVSTPMVGSLGMPWPPSGRDRK